MRLICGLWNIDGKPVEQETLLAMCQALQSPVFPGAIAVWSAGPVGLGQVSFGEPETAFEPDETGVITAADVRLDEPAAARAHFGRPPMQDAALLATLAMAEAAAYLPGDYAVAQWNPRQQTLALTRDALGVRPLCVHHVPGRVVAFASLPAAIFAAGLLARELDREQLARELLTMPAAGATLFRGVRNVLPGTSMLFTSEGERTLRYWQPEPREPMRGTRAAAAEELRSLMTRAVNSCLPPAGPVAAHLSGGLDSSAVAVLASRQLQAEHRHLLAYSFLSETWPGVPMEGERPYVEAVLQQEPAIRWQAVEAVFSPEWLRDQWSADAPLVLSHGAPENIVCYDAAGQGAGAVLSGWGGDEGITFNGRGAFAAAARRGHFRYLHRELRSMRRERGFRMRNMLLGDVLGPLLPPAVRHRMRGRTNRSSGVTAMGDLLAPALLDMAADASPVYTTANPAEMQARLLSNGHLSFRMGRFAAIGARYGLAFRFPLLSRRVVEFALGMPPAWHVHAGWKRRLFREAMEGILPSEVQWRHTKFRSLPAVPYQLTRERDRVLHRVEEISAHRLVQGLFNLKQVAAVLRALPQPETVLDPAAHPALLPLPYVAQVLDYALYLESAFPNPDE